MVEFDFDEFWYMDYCNDCKDLDVMASNQVPCHHPWYCWHDGGEVQELEFKLGELKEKEHWNGYLTPSEKELLFNLKDKKFKLVQRKLREYRKENR